MPGDRIEGSGWFAVPNAVFADKNLRATDKLALLYLYRCAGTDGSAWPSYSTIQEHTGLARATVAASIRRLEENGWIARERRRTEQGDADSNVYRLLIPARHGGSSTTKPRSSTTGLRSSTTELGVVQPLNYGSSNQILEGLPIEGLPIEGLKYISPNGDKSSPAAPDEDPAPSPAKSEDVSPSRVVAIWNETCSRVLPKVEKLTEERRRKLKSRLAADGHRDEAWWRAYFGRIRASPFLRGENDRGWRADFDWAIRSETVVARVLEGRYATSFGQACDAKEASSEWL